LNELYKQVEMVRGKSGYGSCCFVVMEIGKDSKRFVEWYFLCDWSESCLCRRNQINYTFIGKTSWYHMG